MENKIKSITERLLEGKLTKDEADEVLLKLYSVCKQREQHAIHGLNSVQSQTHEDDWANQIVTQYLIEIDEFLY